MPHSAEAGVPKLTDIGPSGVGKIPMQMTAAGKSGGRSDVGRFETLTDIGLSFGGRMFEF